MTGKTWTGRAWAATLLIGLLLTTGAASYGAGGWTPPPDTIVRVTGTPDNGFTIYYLDGSSLSPPTRSESRAECEEYDREIREVRCKVEVRTWYRDLGDTKRAIRYARHF